MNIKNDNKNIITKDAVHRLLKDVKQILKNPLTDNGIYYIHDEADMLRGYAMIIGPEDTPYYGGYFFFNFLFPYDYPHSPPVVTYCTNGDNIRFNPNLYKGGKVCISILNTWKGEQWSSCQTITTILLTLCTLLCKNPLLNEPGIRENHRDFNDYNKIIEYKNIEIAILNILIKKQGVFLKEFYPFIPYVKETFLKNKDKILNYLEDKALKFPNREDIRINIYDITSYINYPHLLNRYKYIVSFLENNGNINDYFVDYEMIKTNDTYKTNEIKLEK
jgi:ubiquitin-conjugating enzyme E2 Z